MTKRTISMTLAATAGMLLAAASIALPAAAQQPLPVVPAPQNYNPHPQWVRPELHAVSSSTLPVELRQQINDAANDAVTKSGLPSASLAIVKDAEVVYTNAYGTARLNPPMPARTDMRYSIGSISKQFTATAILMLQDEGKLNIDDKVSKWLPDLTRANDVTVRQVLSHTSGYQDYWPEDYVMTTMMQPANPQHILDVWGKKPLDFEPGTQWQYSNTNYVIAGRIVEIVTKQDLFVFLQKRIFTPLHMTSVMNQDFRRLADTDAEGYYRHALGPLRPAPKEGFGWMFAAGELAMTARDLAIWDIAMMREDPRILTKASWNAMETEVMLPDGKGSNYGLGVQVTKMHDQRAVFHSGEVSGFVALNVVFPDLHDAICVLTNLDASSGANVVLRAVVPLVFSELKPAAKTAAETDTEKKTADAAAAAKSDPDKKAAEAAAKAPADPATVQAKKIFIGLQQGKMDRALFTQLTNDYFTAEAIRDYADSLGPLGAPVSFEEAAKELRGGMTFHAYKVAFANGKSVTVTTYIEPDGKIEQYLVSVGS
jgi:D-alanyl-D-alanine carboxypeptidase